MRDHVEVIVDITKEGLSADAGLPPVCIRLSPHGDPRMRTDWRIRDTALCTARNGARSKPVRYGDTDFRIT